jgi:anti-sigma regulatory factor (Ser/Thr protein kinase)
VLCRRTFDPTPESVPAARHWARAELIGRYSAQVAQDAELCVSELAANAVVHAGTPYEVRLSERGAQLQIAVADGDRASDPRAQDRDPDAPTGRGLAIVAALAAGHGTRIEGDRKVVWCAIELQ